MPSKTSPKRKRGNLRPLVRLSNRSRISSLTLRVNVSIILGASSVFAAEPSFPNPEWSRATPRDVDLDETQLNAARDYALTGNGSGFIIRHGMLVLSWGDPKKRYDLKSSTKSIGATALGVALLDGKVALDDPALKHHPTFGTPPETNAETGWLMDITLRHLATQTAGFEKPGGYQKLMFAPGTKWLYSDGGPNWLAECITLAYHRDVNDLMFERVFTPIGITRDDLVWRKNQYRPAEIDGVPRREFGSGVSANVNAMARVAFLYLHGGEWDGQRLLPADFVKAASTTGDVVRGLPVVDLQDHGNASSHYGLLWWNNTDGTLKDVPRDAFWSWGLYDSLMVVIPSLDIVVSRAGESWKRAPGADHYAVLEPFLGPIAKAASDGILERKPASSSSVTPLSPPVPPSPMIRTIEWAPVDSIVRKARGSDNWPITWGDDDRLYTAYGDGKGFEPFVNEKLSLGLARISGPADRFIGENLRSQSIEQRGDGVKGRKASGLLMVDGVLYLLARNAGNSQLAWSRDHGQTWTWCDWKFTTGFGYPTFINYGRNFAGARDEFAYIVSHDSDSAYTPADRMVLARVPKTPIPERVAYEFFAGTTADSKPEWTADIAQHAAAFTHRGYCYRSGLTYNAALKRYLWCQILPGPDTRFEGGFGVYDAPEPWGPWTNAFFTPRWDVGPGESASIPTKWISDGGLTIHLVFSGDDHFSVRRGTIALK